MIAEFLVEELNLNQRVDEIRSLPVNSENAMIHIPVREVLSGSENEDPVRMAFLLFRNMSGFLPERLPEEADINRSAQNCHAKLKGEKGKEYGCLLMQSIQNKLMYCCMCIIIISRLSRFV